MKYLHQPCWLAAIMCITISGLAAEVPPPKLTGIVKIGNKKRALLELAEQSRFGSIIARKPILREGERDGAFEITAIDEASGRVWMKNGAEPLELRLEPAPETKLADRTICLRSADLRQVLDIYQDLIGRTVISRVQVAERFTIESGPALSAEQGTAFLERGFADKGIGVKLSGTKFVFVDRAGGIDQLSAIPEPPEAAPPVVPPAKKPAEELFAPGMMKFQDSDVLQVLIIYQELTGRTVLRPNDLPSKKISVRSQTALTRKEAAWLLEAVLFAQGGLTAFREADKFVFVIPSDRKGGLPRIDSPAAPPDGTSFAPGLMNFQDAAIEQVVGVYATLSGQEALPLAPQVPRAKLSIRNQQALSKAEAMFALEAVAALNGLRFESLAGEKVQVVPAPVKAINSR